MRPDDFRSLLSISTFRPFRLYLTDGTAYEVGHPEMAVVGRSIVWLSLPAAGFPVPLGMRRVVVVLLHIVRVEFITTTPEPSAN